MKAHKRTIELTFKSSEKQKHGVCFVFWVLNFCTFLQAPLINKKEES